MGAVFDGACILWQPLVTTCNDGTEDTNSGSCILYDNKKLAINLMILMLSIKGLTVVAAIVAATVYRPQTAANVMEIDVESTEAQFDEKKDRLQTDDKTTVKDTGLTGHTQPQVLTCKTLPQIEGFVEKVNPEGEVNDGFVHDDGIVTEQSSRL